MPIYEYECEKCGQVHEAWQKISAPPLSKCSQCRGKLHKIISRSAFHLKGAGWYATDYAGKSASPAAASSSSGDDGNVAASDTKPGAKINEQKKPDTDKP